MTITSSIIIVHDSFIKIFTLNSIEAKYQLHSCKTSKQPEKYILNKVGHYIDELTKVSLSLKCIGDFFDSAQESKVKTDITDKDIDEFIKKEERRSTYIKFLEGSGLEITHLAGDEYKVKIKKLWGNSLTADFNSFWIPFLSLLCGSVIIVASMGFKMWLIWLLE